MTGVTDPRSKTVTIAYVSVRRTPSLRRSLEMG
jgi:hypothetical protein